MPFYNVTVTTTLAQIVPYNKKRTGITLKNYAGNPAFISNDQVDVLTKGYPLSVGEFFTFLRADGDAPELALYAITSVGTADVRIAESYGEIKE